MSAGLIAPPIRPVLFEGKKTQAQVASATLKRAGIDRATLTKEWGVTLWHVMLRKDRAVVKVSTGKKGADLKGFERWLEERFETVGISKVIVKEQSMGKCCKKGCKPCLNGDKKARQEWTA